MSVEFWLIKGEDKLRLPVNPQVNGYTSPFNYEDVEVEGLGEITKFKTRGLKEFNLESFFPRDYNPTYCSYSNFISPNEFVNKIESWRNTKQPIRYVTTGSAGVNLLVTIRNFIVEERAGSPDDIYYSLDLKEWRELKIESRNTTGQSNTSNSTRPSSSPITPPKTYTVKQNDSLWKISKIVYGDGSQWRKIYEANKSVIGANPHEIKVGQKLVIPK